jgi:arsenate reductase
MSKKVLFVCIRNTARSVIAEALFNSFAKSWTAESAGIEKAEKIDENVRELLEKRGLKAKGRPRTLKEVDLNDFDLIVTVCEESSCVVVPHSSVLRWYIEDPVGKSREVYEKVFEEIEKRIRRLVLELEGVENEKS